MTYSQRHIRVILPCSGTGDIASHPDDGRGRDCLEKMLINEAYRCLCRSVFCAVFDELASRAMSRKAVSVAASVVALPLHNGLGTHWMDSNNERDCDLESCCTSIRPLAVARLLSTMRAASHRIWKRTTAEVQKKDSFGTCSMAQHTGHPAHHA